MRITRDESQRSSPPTLVVIWDFDAAIGQVNATHPYNFRRTPLDQELEGVQILADLSARLDILMTFAVVGAAVEDLPHPFGVGELVRRLHQSGHEIASHSWRHEWLPHLSTQQLRRSLLRSKMSLESAIGEVGGVSGFVPPFNRPMTWLSRGALHPGDRWAVPLAPGTSFGRLAKDVAGAGYRWIRIGHQPASRRWARPWPRRLGTCFVLPHQHSGFGAESMASLEQIERQQGPLVVSGHPSGLLRHTDENRARVEHFLELAARLRDRGRLTIATPAVALGLSNGAQDQ